MPDADQTAALDGSTDSPIDDLAPGDTLSVPVRRDGDDLRILTDDDRQVSLPGLDPADLPGDLAPGDTGLLVGDLSTYAQGVNAERSYLFLDGVDEFVSIANEDSPSPATTTDGLNPFADPERVREAGLHRGEG